MITVVEKKDCCGCGACVQACPLGCISMEEDIEGFLYPKVDARRCVQCDVCVGVCPILGEKKQNVRTGMIAYAAKVRDAELLRKSSSGGVFSLLAQWVLDQDGVVFGAAFDKAQTVHHIGVENADDLNLLRGSKYVQSRIENTYQKAKAALELGRTVLFTGTPCQTAGLRTFLKKEYTKLYTVDLICHGAPSPKIWRKYLAHQEKSHGSSVSKVSFREKNPGWKRYSVEQVFLNGNKYRRLSSEDIYMKLFLRDICLRPSCYKCLFKGLPRMADMTLGDAWGIQNLMPDMDDDKGTSVVLLHTEKGHQLWKSVESQMYYRQGDMEALLRGNKAFWKSARVHPRRQRFFAAVNRGASLEKLEYLSQNTFTKKIRGLLNKAFSAIKKSIKR